MWYDWLWLILLFRTGDSMSSISKSKAIVLCCCDHKCILIRERRLFETAGLIWKTSAPNAIYTVQTGDVTPTHQEHESRPRLCINNDATFLPWTFDTVHAVCARPPAPPRSPLPAPRSPNSPPPFSFWTTDVSCAPGAGTDKSGSASALCGSTQIREELFIRDCGVLSFTTAHFPSFHHAAIEPTLPGVLAVRPGQKYVFADKY